MENLCFARHSRESGNPLALFVIPAQAGIHFAVAKTTIKRD